METGRKADSFCEVNIYGKRWFQCNICSRCIATKDNILRHLAKQHGLSPFKGVRKLYKKDDNFPVPRSTLNRWKKSAKQLEFGYQQDSAKPASDHQQLEESDTSMSTSEQVQYETPLLDAEEQQPNISDIFMSASEELQCEASSSDIELSDSSLDSAVSTSSDSDFSDSEINLLDENTSDSENIKALQILSCFQRHKLTASACVDILKTLKSVSASDSCTLFNYDHLLSFVPTTSYKDIHYCEKCESTFPENKAVYRCSTEDCPGLRYIGNLMQQQEMKQPVKCFTVANLTVLLCNLLKSPGILEDIKQHRHNTEGNVWKDITSGELYKEHLKRMSPANLNLTVTLNTDGVNLYSSSKTELWPVFLVVNELSPAVRFARENIMLAGLWQGKGKPPFKILFQCLSEEMNYLSSNGLQIQLEEEMLHVTLSLLCVTLDLPAKAGALNMTYFNGTEACITCEETGQTVKQGRGHSKSYPYRAPEVRYQMRSQNSVLEYMNAASARSRVKGFKGISGLSFFQTFNMVSGTVPDYMHGVLLGITKTLMCKWFSASESGQDYFLGKKLTQLAERLKNIKPPYQIERLPRDIEKHYNNFKATELQAFLLYYSLPCLSGLLPEKYLEHYSMFSEAVYILLGDNITATKLERAENLLTSFYISFAELYGQGSCGLNVHNVCAHLPYYVRMLGPIWAWSCFAFEDANAKLLQSVHGTGDVVKQALRSQEISVYIRSVESSLANKPKLKITHSTSNCEIVGKMKIFASPSAELLQALNVENADNINKVQRVIVNGRKFYSSEYSRMKKRFCHCVLYSSSTVGLVQYFVFVSQQNKVYAVTTKLQDNLNSWVSNLPGGKHLMPVIITSSTDVVPVENLSCTLVFMQTEESSEALVVKMANKHGHAVFK